MAAYKAEFLSHYYETHPRPRQAHSMGRIGEWAPIAAKLPGLANLFSKTGFSKKIAGVAPARNLPRFSRTFRSQFAPKPGGQRVVLFDDTFNNHFRPATAIAAQRVLEAAGCAVELPAERLCCGRPYYDYGMLDRAKSTLERAVRVLSPQLEAGVPVVMLEPGCLSVFRDELKQLLPSDAGAARLAASAVSLAEFLQGKDLKLKPLGKNVLLHGHCHQKALWGTGAEAALLRAAGCEVSAPDTGCCGMAGSFGYRPEFYEASMRIAALGVGPALAAAPGAEVVANGFSCREQVETLGRPTLHLAELIAKAL